MDTVLDEMIAQGQGIGWRIAIVRVIHGADVDALSVDEMLAEFDRLRRSLVIVKRRDGSTETINELRLRLEYDRAP